MLPSKYNYLAEKRDFYSLKTVLTPSVLKLKLHSNLSTEGIYYFSYNDHAL